MWWARHWDQRKQIHHACQTASYPRVRKAFTGNAPCSALSSWRLTTSGLALANQAKRLLSPLLMLLMLKVATFNKSLSVLYLWARLPRTNRVLYSGWSFLPAHP
jgi:hypothetical protein